MFARLTACFQGLARHHRSPQAQQVVDTATARLALYHFRACPYCMRVRRTMKRLQLNIELRDAAHNPVYRQELRLQGGKLQAPCLKIEQDGTPDEWLYESADINRYLQRRFPIQKTG